jgi:drug/metabolite transporter (DMT)-like permease
MFFGGLGAALVAAGLFNVGVALQAVEARKAPKRLGLKVGILGHLLRRPLWLLGVALGLVGIAPQVLALAWAPFAVVQTALAAGIVLLVFIGVRFLGERVGRRTLAGVGLLIAGVALVSWGAPAHSEGHRGGIALIAVVSATALLAVAPFALKRVGGDRGMVLVFAAGVAFAGTNIATKLGSDDVGLRHWWNAAAWGIAATVLAIVATVTGMTAFQKCAATVAVPISTAVQTFLPIVLEPIFLREHYRSVTTQLVPIAAGVLIAAIGVTLVGSDPNVAELAAGR